MLTDTKLRNLKPRDKCQRGKGSMRQIGFDKKFTLLAQEAHLTKNTILTGFDLLLKANYFQDKDGYFYSSFFNISIGIERLLKLAVITDYMLMNNYSSPTIKQLKTQFGHDVKTLYSEGVKLMRCAVKNGVHRFKQRVDLHSIAV